ncbi:glycosyltransferase family 4 protein [Methanomethylovorans sp.]|uniref:glycosyltransferase family 4 protein n=1 Tax=Methanomethylovorans sp. TaxID=2758717 RepID=UPI002FDEF091
MKIAIIAPSPVPFTIGGAELLFSGMQDAINNYTSHQCELIKLTTKENTFWDLVESYYKFYQLDLSHFDMIISTKYPSWMVRHRNHIVYMVHPLRGLYDTYHLCNDDPEVPAQLRTGLVKEILDITEIRIRKDKNVEDLFQKLFQLRSEQDNYTKELFTFPGPFIRKIIHFLDRWALSYENIREYFSISENVKKRQDYFPPSARVKVIYPPSKIEDFECRGFEYLFTASRLDSPKRIDMLIEAMKFVPHNIRLKIAGEGPEKARLMELAQGDTRIEFLGFVTENELVDLYANALAVLFVPQDEDYGYITIEAMMSAKPVITAFDSGGPLEFVSDSKTGFIVDPEPKHIADKINYFVEHVEEARKMGLLANEKVKKISWNDFVAKLIGERDIRSQRKKKVLVLATYSCYPPRGGGQQRLYNIYSRLAKKFDVTICSIIENDKEEQKLILKNGLTQICIPQSIEHARCQWEIEGKTGLNLYDVLMIDLVERSENYIEKVKKLADDADIVIFSHPYLFVLKNWVDLNEKIIVYESHNVEYLLKKDYAGIRYSQKVFDIEKEAAERSDLVFTTSDEDKEHLMLLYGIARNKILVTPNGVDASKIELISLEEKKQLKKEVGLSDHRTILFIGSWHPPNLEALKFILDEITSKLSDCVFLVIGSIKHYYMHEYEDFPKNVLAFGVVDEDEKYELYKLADLAINPMFSGSGTNLKMLDYMSAGIPTISTPTGARGLDIENGIHALICTEDQMREKIIELMNTETLRNRLRLNARKLVESRYSWDKIAASIIAKLKEIA